jgi:hypothetical protein
VKDISSYNKKTVSATLNQFCHLSKEHDSIEVSEWNNEEGYDVYITRGESYKYFTLTHGELNAIITLTKLL